jgi:hypothetical protein
MHHSMNDTHSQFKDASSASTRPTLTVSVAHATRHGATKACRAALAWTEALAGTIEQVTINNRSRELMHTCAAVTVRHPTSLLHDQAMLPQLALHGSVVAHDNTLSSCPA